MKIKRNAKILYSCILEKNWIHIYLHIHIPTYGLKTLNQTNKDKAPHQKDNDI